MKTFRYIFPAVNKSVAQAFELQHVGYRHKHHHYVEQEKARDMFFFLLLESEAEIRSGQKYQAYPAGTFIVMSHASRLYYGRNGSWIRSFIRVRGHFMTQLLTSHTLPIHKPFMLEDRTIFDVCLARIQEEILAGDPPSGDIIRNHIHTFVIQLERERCTASIAGSDPSAILPGAVRAARRCINMHYRENISVKTLAEQSGYTLPYFIALFKKHTGKTPGEYMIDLRLSEAALLLEDRKLKVREAAAMVGYQNNYYFSRLFKARYGLPPQVYRERTVDSSG